MKYVAAPLLLIAIILGYVGAVLGLMALHHVDGSVGAFVVLLALFASCAFIGSDTR